MTRQIIFLSIVVFVLVSCQAEKKKILYINSYHDGYAPSDQVMKEIIKNLPTDSFDLSIVFMDSKRFPSEEIIAKKVDSIKKVIADYKPDLLIASDDNAIKYLVEPFYNHSDIPIVYCGVNWSAEEYNLSTAHITGMLEVLPLRESLLFTKKYYPAATRIAILSENSLSEQKNTQLLDTLYKNAGLLPSYFLADNFQEWKQKLLEANEIADIIYFPTNGAIKDWDNKEARKYMETHTKKPVFTCDDFMMQWCVFGFTKVAAEQGIWAAETAKRILNGTSAGDIPITRNQETKKWFNRSLATNIGFKPEIEWIKEAEIVE